MRLGLLAVALLASCYSPPKADEDCTITCTEGVPENCPGDLVCEAGYCVGGGQVCRPTFVEVAAGTGFACAIDDSSAVWCWGSLTGTRIATRVDATHHWQSLDAGGGHVCGIADGALYCWGKNDHQEVTGTVIGDIAEPFQIDAGIAQWTQVSAGVDYTCAVGDGRLLCWGRNDFGQLGDNTLANKGVPTPVAAQLTDWTYVSTGDEHTCGVSTMFGVHCWGRNIRGELGPNATGDSRIPLAVSRAGAPLLAASVAVGTNSSCAIATDQQVYCWGLNNVGQLGDKRFVDWATIAMTSEPQRASDVPFTKIQAGSTHYCGLSADAVYCWGGANSGGIGQGVWDDARLFSKTIAAGATDVSVGHDLNPLTLGTDLELGCAIVDGGAQCWGDNRFGQLAQGTATLAATPTEVAGDLRYSTIAAGNQHACGISGESVYCWGSTERAAATGFLYGATMPRTPCAPNPIDPSQPLCDVAAPRQLSYAPNPVTVTAGAAFTCALSNGVVSCWGNGLGGTTGIKRDLMQPGGGMWKTLLPTGRDAQCGTAQTANEPVYCVGNVLGTGSSNTMRTMQLDGFTAIALGGFPSFGVYLDGSGKRYGYGDNSMYQLGDGTTTSYAALTAIGTTTYSAISTRSDANFACAIRSSDQHVECWGASRFGKTGSSTLTMPTMVPNEVMGLSGCTAIAVGFEHACALCEGAIKCWGDNRSGQLAEEPHDAATSIPRTVDLALSGDPWAQLVAGARFTCARSESGRVFCWGLSERGALGNGGTGANLPVTVRASQID